MRKWLIDIHRNLYLELRIVMFCLKDMKVQHSLLMLWYYCTEHRAMIFCLTARNIFQFEWKILTQQHLGRKEVDQTYADLIGISVFISEMEVKKPIPQVIPREMLGPYEK